MCYDTCVSLLSFIDIYLCIFVVLRFWYENPGVFSPAQLVQIKQTSLATVICQSSDSIEEIQSNVFHMAHYPQDYLPCSNVPKLDLKLWADCCQGLWSFKIFKKHVTNSVCHCTGFVVKYNNFMMVQVDL